MSTRREKIIELAAQIMTLRVQLRQLEAQMDRLLPDDPAQPAVTQARDKFYGGGPSSPIQRPLIDVPDLVEQQRSMAGQIVELLDTAPGPLDVAAIAQTLKFDNLNSVRGTCVRLANDGRIRRIERGLFDTAKDDRLRNEQRE